MSIPSRVDLGFFPTPFHGLSNLSQDLQGPKVYIKRDDLTGLALGGNKTRKLEYLLADAQAKGCNAVVTAGAAQSNHCRQTAAAAAKLGLECHLLLGGHAPKTSNGNLLLDELCGATIVWCGEHRKGEDISAYIESLKHEGKAPYLVPYGGSNELGATGFYSALIELSQQVDLTNFTRLIFASSSGATHAGLVLGAKKCAPHLQVIGIQIDKESSEESKFNEVVLRLTKSTNEFLGLSLVVEESDILLREDFIGAGYGVVGALEKEAIGYLARKEGILLDPVYTGRAFGALLAMIRNGEISADENVIFWHTGGAPALFSYADDLLA